MPIHGTFPALVAGLICLGPFAAVAQNPNDVAARFAAMEDRIKALEAEIQELKSQQAATTAALTAATPAAPAPATQTQAAALAESATAQAPVTLGGAGGAASKVLNPDIAVIGDFIGAAGYGAHRSIPSLEMHETELALQAILDPYARADFFLSFGEHSITVEEGYLTFPALPGHLQLRVGKMRSAFGKVNTLHNHVLPWIDRPLVSYNLVGGEDGIDDTGLSLSRVFAGPKDLFFEGTAQVFRGDADFLFHSYKRSDVSTVEHLRAYKDITESTNIDVGASFARGHSVLAENITDQLYGIDATVRWKPLRRAIYHSFVGRSEFVWSHYIFPGATTTPFGYYVSGDYQFARRWFLGGRFDRSERLDNLFAPASDLGIFNNADVSSIIGPRPGNLPIFQDTSGSLLLTYWPSEFSQIRGQLRRTSYGDNLTANEFLFQFVFSIGAHGAHPF